MALEQEHVPPTMEDTMETKPSCSTDVVQTEDSSDSEDDNH